MISYVIVSLFTFFNLILYLVIHFPLDYIILTHKDSSKTQEVKEEPPRWANNRVMLLTLLPSMYLWILFGLIPLTAFVQFQLFYSLPILQIEPMNTFIQIVGVILIIIATFIACWGRISRGNRAFSWGIPSKLEV